MEEEGTGIALCQLQHTHGQRNVVLGHQQHTPAPKGAKTLPPLWESTSLSSCMGGTAQCEEHSKAVTPLFTFDLNRTRKLQYKG